MAEDTRMKLAQVQFNDVNYYHRERALIGRVVCSDPIDGASLFFEPLDVLGDIMGGDLFRCEASDLSPVTREIWERFYPPDNPGCFKFWEMEGRAE